MPQPYPDPSFKNITALIQYTNTVTEGWMTILVFLACPVVLFILMKAKYYRTSDSLLTSFFITFVLSSFFFAAGLLAGKFIVIFLLLTVASGIYSMIE